MSTQTTTTMPQTSQTSQSTESGVESGAAFVPSTSPSTIDFTSTISTTVERERDLMVKVQPHPLNPSLCIPSVHFSITRKDIFTIFRKLDLGYIDYIQIGRARGGNAFAPVYIHFLYWFDKPKAQQIREKVNDGDSFKIKYDQAHPERFWKVVKSDLSKLLPNISREPTLSWRAPLNDDGTEETPNLDNTLGSGTLPDVKERTISLVIPRIRKGYTPAHIRFVLMATEIVDTIERIDLTFPKESAPLHTKPYMTAYAHVVLSNTPYANYVLNYLSEERGRQVMINHDVAPVKWAWYAKKSDLPKPDLSTRPKVANMTDKSKSKSADATITDEPTIEF